MNFILDAHLRVTVSVSDTGKHDDDEYKYVILYAHTHLAVVTS